MPLFTTGREFAEICPVIEASLMRFAPAVSGDVFACQMSILVAG
jgi:hypothetical protein